MASARANHIAAGPHKSRKVPRNSTSESIELAAAQVLMLSVARTWRSMIGELWDFLRNVRSFCQSVHFVASDAAADETKAIRILAGRVTMWWHFLSQC